jgi:hypothetical protein
MRFLLDADDDWQEGFRSYAYPKTHNLLARIGNLIGTPLYSVGTSGPNQFVGSVPIDEDALELELVALGFERNPVACLKSTRDGRVSEGSWVLRSHDDPNGVLGKKRQLHVTLFKRIDGQDGRDLMAHEELDWQDDPIGHLRGEDYSPEDGVAYARELIDNYSFVALRYPPEKGKKSV